MDLKRKQELRDQAFEEYRDAPVSSWSLRVMLARAVQLGYDEALKEKTDD